MNVIIHVAETTPGGETTTNVSDTGISSHDISHETSSILMIMIH